MNIWYTCSNTDGSPGNIAGPQASNPARYSILQATRRSRRRAKPPLGYRANRVCGPAIPDAAHNTAHQGNPFVQVDRACRAKLGDEPGAYLLVDACEHQSRESL